MYRTDFTVNELYRSVYNVINYFSPCSYSGGHALKHFENTKVSSVVVRSCDISHTSLQHCIVIDVNERNVYW